jgi:hypothetical protein
MIPQIRISFPNLPLPKGTKVGFPVGEGSKSFTIEKLGKTEFRWYEKIRAFDEQTGRAAEEVISKHYPKLDAPSPMEGVPIHNYCKWIISSCRNGHNIYQGLSKVLQRRLDVNAPASNAFAKMIEICYEPEVSALLESYAKSAKPLTIACLAEAPGTFPIAILYWIGNKYPSYIAQKKYDFRCTTLEPPKGEVKEGEALRDLYDLISLYKNKWFFMDHTSPEDTKKMIETLGSHKYPLVTGDIGLPPASWFSSESELFRIDLGQFVGACCLLSEGGMATLKGFMFGGKASLGIIRLAMIFFGGTKIYKPRSSRMNNNEMYLILSGFKSDAFDKVLPDLLRVMKEANDIAGLFAGEKGAFAHYPSFLSDEAFGEDLSDRFYHYMMASTFSRAHIDAIVPLCLEKNIDYKGDPYEILKKLIVDLKSITSTYLDDWIAHFPVRPLGRLFYDATGISPKRRVYTPSSNVAKMDHLT